MARGAGDRPCAVSRLRTRRWRYWQWPPGHRALIRLGVLLPALGGRGSAPPVRIKTVGHGADTAVLTANSPLLEGTSGRYFADCIEGEVLDRRVVRFRA